MCGFHLCGFAKASGGSRFETNKTFYQNKEKWVAHHYESSVHCDTGWDGLGKFWPISPYLRKYIVNHNLQQIPNNFVKWTAAIVWRDDILILHRSNRFSHTRNERRLSFCVKLIGLHTFEVLVSSTHLNLLITCRCSLRTECVVYDIAVCAVHTVKRYARNKRSIKYIITIKNGRKFALMMGEFRIYAFPCTCRRHI